MYRQTAIDLPDEVQSEDQVREWLAGELGSWSDALDLEVWQIDPRANYVGHDILQIDVQDGAVHVHYTVDYYVYFGCRDIDGGDEEHREITGTLEDGKIVFQTYVQPDPLAPSDEL